MLFGSCWESWNIFWAMGSTGWKICTLILPLWFPLVTIKSSQHTPVEHAMNFLNNDFITTESKVAGADDLRGYYLSTVISTTQSVSSGEDYAQSQEPVNAEDHGKAGVFGKLFWNTAVLAERSMKNYSRNLLAYGVRAGMYGGMLTRALTF